MYTPEDAFQLNRYIVIRLLMKTIPIVVLLISVIVISGCTSSTSNKESNISASSTDCPNLLPITSIREIINSPQSSVGKCVEIEGYVIDASSSQMVFTDNQATMIRMQAGGDVSPYLSSMIDVYGNFSTYNLGFGTPIKIKGIVSKGNDRSMHSAMILGKELVLK